jgi:hypothetical protein
LQAFPGFRPSRELRGSGHKLPTVPDAEA